MARGFWRRWVILTFNRNFERDEIRRERKDYVEDLAKEAHGIVRWAITGAARVKASSDFTKIPTSDEMLAKWRQQTDQIAQFIAEKLTVVTTGVEDMMESSVLYETYKRWADETGHRPMTSTKFSDRLTALGHKIVLDGGVQVRPLTQATMKTRPRFAAAGAQREFLDD